MIVPNLEVEITDSEVWEVICRFKTKDGDSIPYHHALTIALMKKKEPDKSYIELGRELIEQLRLKIASK